MKNNNQINIPEARAAMDKFKMEAASEVGVNLKEGYNGDLTAARPVLWVARWSRKWSRPMSRA